MTNKNAVLITGGAGFIGTNLAHSLLLSGKKVIILDNLSREGSRVNLQWLVDNHGSNLKVVIADVRDRNAIVKPIREADTVFHLAAQVAVTKSLINPIEDFKVNVEGTLNILETLRTIDEPPFMVFTSTNKVYGKLNNVKLIEHNQRYTPASSEYINGISEGTNLEFNSPYGCSKGSADQYILDYYRSYSLPVTVFRMSCIYGPHQYGTEDQGWVAHFIMNMLQNKPITIYGDGKQVRDILFANDLISAFLLVLENKNKCIGEAFNIGGGKDNSISLVEFVNLLKKYNYPLPSVSFAPWRNGDQYFYISDTTKFSTATGWKQSVPLEHGIDLLFQWLSENINGINNKYHKGIEYEYSVRNEQTFSE